MSEPIPQTSLPTQRLVLRPFETSDAVDVARIAGNPHLADTLFGLPRPYGIDDARQWIAGHAEELTKGRYSFAVRLQADDSLVGSIALHPSSTA